MSTLTDRISAEVRRLPEDLASQVYDFIRNLEVLHGIASGEEPLGGDDWPQFFNRHAREVEDDRPLNREEIYAERLR
jgi:hypothetical protein